MAGTLVARAVPSTTFLLTVTRVSLPPSSRERHLPPPWCLVWGSQVSRPVAAREARTVS